jgi:hypothetical protein
MKVHGTKFHRNSSVISETKYVDVAYLLFMRLIHIRYSPAIFRSTIIWVFATLCKNRF